MNINTERIFTYVLLLMLAITSCKQGFTNIEVKKITVALDSLKLETYADTIVCDMVVKNPDKEDKWMEECLGRLKRNALIDSVFNDVYTGTLIAYSFDTHKALSVKEVKRLEEASGYSRDIIGKFQFREAWYYDKQNHSFIKKVHSIIFGYESYDESGYVKNYKPLFKVEL